MCASKARVCVCEWSLRAHARAQIDEEAAAGRIAHTSRPRSTAIPHPCTRESALISSQKGCTVVRAPRRARGASRSACARRSRNYKRTRAHAHPSYASSSQSFFTHTRSTLFAHRMDQRPSARHRAWEEDQKDASTGDCKLVWLTERYFGRPPGVSLGIVSDVARSRSLCWARCGAY